MDIIYAAFALLAVLLGCTSFIIGAWIFRYFHYRANSNYMGISVMSFGSVGILHFVSMISTTEQAVLFWQQVAWSITVFCPSIAVWSQVHYRGYKKFLEAQGADDIAVYAEAGWMIFSFGISFVLLGLIWLVPDAFFSQRSYFRTQQFTLLATDISYGHQLYEMFSIMVLIFMIAFIMRFFAFEEKIPVGILIIFAGLMPIIITSPIPITSKNIFNPIPNLGAIMYPLLGLISYGFYVRFKPDIHLTYAAAIHPTAWHDLRNFTAAVQSRISLLSQQPEVNARIRDEIQQIEYAMGELNTYIRQVRTPRPTRLSHVQKDDVLVTDVLATTAQFWEKIASHKNLQWYAALTSEPIILTVDPTWFKRTLDNLIQNAIKFTPPNGSISIRSIASDEYFFVAVKDTGIGIPESDQNRVFEDYYRGKNAQMVEGDGLGLASVAEFASYHNGKIELVSVVGQGTTITLRLPLD